MLETRATLPPVPAGSGTWLSCRGRPPRSASTRCGSSRPRRAGARSPRRTTTPRKRALTVLAEEGLWAGATSDRTSYPAASPPGHGGPPTRADPFEGIARTTVEDAGGEVAAARTSARCRSTRAGSVSWDARLEHRVDTGGPLRLPSCASGRPAATERRRHRRARFDIEPGLAVLARVRPQPVDGGRGQPVTFALLAQNQGANAALEGATARLRVQLEGARRTRALRDRPRPFRTCRRAERGRPPMRGPPPGPPAATPCASRSSAEAPCSRRRPRS